MSYIIVDVGSDGPIPVEFSMVCFGPIVFDDRLDQTFYGQIRPVSDRFVPEWVDRQLDQICYEPHRNRSGCAQRCWFRHSPQAASTPFLPGSNQIPFRLRALGGAVDSVCRVLPPHFA